MRDRRRQSENAPGGATWNACACLVGMGVLRVTSTAMRPPLHSTPSENGATSSSSIPCTFAPPCPVRIAPCIAAPLAAASSGLVPPVVGRRPPKRAERRRCTAGVRDAPPTAMISRTAEGATPASERTCAVGRRGGYALRPPAAAITRTIFVSASDDS